MSNLTFEGIIIHNKGIAIEINHSFEIMFGYTHDELIGKNIIDLIIPKEYHCIIADNIIKDYALPYEVEAKRKDGSVFPVELEGRSISSKEGSGVRAVAVRDITYRKEAEQKLKNALRKAQESDQLKSAFLANMSHEMRTPMNSILGFSELLKEAGLSDKDLKNYINIIAKSGERMLNTINDLIDMSKLEAKQIQVYVSEVNVNEQLDYIYSFFKTEIEKQGIAFSFRKSKPESEVILKTDPEKLYGILRNLVENALKCTNEGSIEYGYEMKDNFIEFYVKDTGIGIPKDKQQSVFERFIQVEMTRSKTLEGSGLGLAITKAYVEMLGGKIWVESEEGKGSVFYFTIPI